MVNNKVRENRTVFVAVSVTVLTIYSLLLIVPLLWAVNSALKNSLDLYENVFGLPTKIKPENFLQAFTKISVPINTVSGSRSVNLIEMFYNTIFYAGVGTLVVEFSRCVCAYCVAKYRKYKAMRIFHSIVIVLLVVQLPVALASQIRWFTKIGVYNNMYGLVLISGTFTGAHFLYFYAAFKSISWEYAEAAFMDGASNFAVFFYIMLPQIKATFLALYLLTFISAWNDYSSSLTLMPNYPVVAYGLYKYNSLNAASSVPLQLAGCVLIALPILILFLIFKDKLIGNLNIGGLKG